MDEQKQSLIDLIKWYRDEWHKADWCHSEMIEKLTTTNDEKLVELYEKVVDGWLDD
jgi:hypothetical protein